MSKKAGAESAPEKTGPQKTEKTTSIRPLTQAEIAVLEDDTTPPADYANSNLAENPAETSTEGTIEEAAKEEKAEESTEVKTEDKPADKPAAAPEPEDSFTKLERELAKPEGKEDLKDFSPREKAYFHQMRRDRKARQKAETERDQALFREKKIKEEATRKPEEAKDPLSGKEDDDLLTVAEAKEILKQKPTEEKPADNKAAAQAAQARYLVMCEKEARAAHPDDFDAVMELSDDLLSTNTDALKELSEKTQAGENPAEIMYQLIKQQKDFEILYPAAEIRAKAKKTAAAPNPASPSAPAVTPTPEEKAKEEKAKQAEKALEQNVNRTKTTAHASSREGKPAEELTLEEIGSMSDMEFAKLPKQVRNKYLKSYGA